MGILKGILILILSLAVMGGVIVGSYVIAQDNPFSGQHEHQLSLVEATEPTCDLAGVRQHYVCSGCKGIFADEKGYVALKSEDITISPMGHNWLDATCGSAKVCEFCKATDGEKQDHRPGNPIKENIVAATCMSEGSYDSVIYCTSCGEKISSESMISEKKGHTPGATIIRNEKAPTCYAEGSYETVVLCAFEGCGAEMSTTTVKVDKIAHTPSATAVKTNEKAASCSEVGSYDMVVYCSVENCGAVTSRETKVAPALGHVDGNNDNACDRCLSAICTNHTPVMDKAIAATCTSDGLTEGSHCSNCGQVIVAQKVVPAAHKLVLNAGGTLSVAKDGTLDASALVVTFNCSVCDYVSEVTTDYTVDTDDVFADNIVITSGDYTATFPALDLVNYEASSTYNVGTYNDRTPTVTTAFAHKESSFVCKVISGDAINLIADGSAVVYSRYELSNLCNENVTVTYDAATGYHYASKKAHTIPYLATYGATLTITGTVEIKTTHRVNVNNALIIGTDDTAGIVRIERTQLVGGNNHVLGLYGGADLTIKNGTLTTVGIATSDWAVDLFVGANGTNILIEKNGNFVSSGKGEYAIYSNDKDTVFIVDGTVVSDKPFHFKTTLILGDQYEYGFQPSLYIRHGSVTIDATGATVSACSFASLQVGSEKENATGYLSIKSSADLIYLHTNSRLTFAKGTLNLECTASGKAALNSAGAYQSFVLDVKKGMTINSKGLGHVFGLWSSINQYWMIEEGATFKGDGNFITNNNSSVTVMAYKTVEMNIDGQFKKVVVANTSKTSFANTSALVFPGIDTSAMWTTDSSVAAVNGFSTATSGTNTVYYKETK